MKAVSKKTLVSIIVPIYNAGKYLDQCLESVTNQTHTNLQIILVNNGSTDNSLKICNDFAAKDKRIKVIDTNAIGVSAARNLGMKNSKGDWVCFVDADDYIDLNYVKILLDYANKHHSSYVCCGYNRVYEGKVEPVNNSGEEIELTSYEYLNALLNVQLGYGFCHMKLINRQILTSIKFNTQLKVGEDALFNIELCKNLTKVNIYKTPLYNYRFNNNSVVRKYDKDYLKKYLESMKCMTKYINTNYKTDGQIKQNLQNYIVYHVMLIAVNYCFHKQNINKKESLKYLCNVKEFKNAIKNSNYSNLSLTREITLFTLKHKLYFLTELICRFRQWQFNR